MLDMLKQANELFGRFTPAELQELTPREFEYMVNGAQKHQLDQWQHDYAMRLVTQPVGLITDKNDNDTLMRQNLQKMQIALDNFNNEAYQKQEEAKRKRQKEFSAFFDRFSRRNTEKKGV